MAIPLICPAQNIPFSDPLPGEVTSARPPGMVWWTFFYNIARMHSATTATVGALASSGAWKARESASTVPSGAFYTVTDRGAVLYQARGGAWHYLSGVWRALFVNLPFDLGANDAGFTFNDETYGHTFVWNGAGWEFPKGEVLPGSFMFGEATPGEVGWHLCDGATVTRCKRDGKGGTESHVLPDATGCFVKHGTYSATPVVATAGAISGTAAAVSAGTPAGTNDALTFSGTSASASSDSAGTPAGSVTVDSKTLTTANFVTTAGTVPGVTEVSHSHTASFSGSALGTHGHTVIATGTINTPGFTGTALATHDHGAGTLAVATTGEPKHLVIPMWARL